ncbi:hypothetical protein [Gulosibacter sediminis]|uniref:hypothetical protein n=1 Tax=Gulosibacter sediminis TaxID=1729695 RepID=UPI0024A7F3AF|nr:hypothetical protein [Gulosibacter sediminis]
MSRQSLAALEDAIRAHFEEEQDEPGVVSAWVVAVEIQALQSDDDTLDPVYHRNDYAVSAGSPNTMLGLTAWVGGTVEATAWGDDTE